MCPVRYPWRVCLPEAWWSYEGRKPADWSRLESRAIERDEDSSRHRQSRHCTESWHYTKKVNSYCTINIALYVALRQSRHCTWHYVNVGIVRILRQSRHCTDTTSKSALYGVVTLYEESQLILYNLILHCTWHYVKVGIVRTLRQSRHCTDTTSKSALYGVVTLYEESQLILYNLILHCTWHYVKVGIVRTLRQSRHCTDTTSKSALYNTGVVTLYEESQLILYNWYQQSALILFPLWFSQKSIYPPLILFRNKLSHVIVSTLYGFVTLQRKSIHFILYNW